MGLKVSEVARLAGVSVRTLHHYDEIGLVHASARSEAGYRLYAPRDLERLQQVLFFKELGFPLEEINRILASPDFDLRAALQMQRELLVERAARVNALITAVDVAIQSQEQETTMTNEERFAVFGNFEPEQYEAEVKQAWGESEAYRTHAKRARGYRKEDWAKIKAEADCIFTELAKLLERGAAPSSPEARALAEQHRRHIETWFYACPPSMHRALGEMYVADARFSANIDRYGENLTAFVRSSWIANAERRDPGDSPAR